MAITLSSVKMDTASVDVEFGGETATIIYKPLQITQEKMEMMDKEVDGSQRFLCEVVKSWDVLYSPKKKVPLTLAGLRSLPLPFIQKCVLAILGDRPDSVGEAERP